MNVANIESDASSAPAGDPPVAAAKGHEAKRLLRANIADSVRRGRSVGEAAQIFGVSIQTVRNACAEHGVSYPGQKPAADRNAVAPRVAPTNPASDPTSAKRLKTTAAAKKPRGRRSPAG